LAPIRYIVGYTHCFVHALICIVVMLGEDIEKPLPTWKRKFLIFVVRPSARLILLCAGVIWWTNVERKDVDYKKWLGPDWKCTFDGAGLQISNHTSWFDIMLLIWSDYISYLSSMPVKKLVGVNLIASSV